MKLAAVFLLLAGLSPLSIHANQCPNSLNTVTLPDFPCVDAWLVSLFQELDCPIDLLTMKTSSSRRMRLLLDGQIQVLLGLSRTPEREQNFQFSAPIASHKLILYGAKGSLVSQNIERWCDHTMRTASIILPPRGHFGPKVEALMKGDQCAAKLIYAPLGVEQASKMLMAGRGDLIVASEHWLKDQSVEVQKLVEKLDVLVWEENTELAFKGLNENFIHRINDVIEARALAGNTPCGLAPMPAEISQTKN